MGEQELGVQLPSPSHHQDRAAAEEGVYLKVIRNNKVEKKCTLHMGMVYKINASTALVFSVSDFMTNHV